MKLYMYVCKKYMYHMSVCFPIRITTGLSKACIVPFLKQFCDMFLSVSDLNTQLHVLDHSTHQLTFLNIFLLHLDAIFHMIINLYLSFHTYKTLSCLLLFSPGDSTSPTFVHELNFSGCSFIYTMYWCN